MPLFSKRHQFSFPLVTDIYPDVAVALCGGLSMHTHCEATIRNEIQLVVCELRFSC
jgi:hypothetical protein